MKKKTQKDVVKLKNKVVAAETSQISLAPLNFEDALSALLQVKPVENKELAASKKKSKPKTEK